LYGRASADDQPPGHAASNLPPALLFSSGIHKFVDNWDKCLNEYRRYVEK